MKASEALPPESDATIVCVPWASEVGVKLQEPVASAVTVPRTVVPSLIVITALADASPVSASLLVMPSVEELPVSVPSRSDTPPDVL